MGIYDSKRDLLGLLYDSIDEICDGLYIVTINGETGIVDANNTVKIPFGTNEIFKTATTVLICENDEDYFWTEYSVKDFKKTGNSYLTVYEIPQYGSNKRDRAYVVEDKYGKRGLINKYGDLVLPTIYDSIYRARSSSNKEYVKARVFPREPIKFATKQFTGEKATDESYIIFDANYTNPDCLFAEESGIDGIHIVATSLLKDKEHFGFYNRKCFKYKIRVNGKIVGKEYDDIMTRLPLHSHKLFETYTYKDNKTYMGLIDADGRELVESDKYTKVDYIGNGLSIVKNDNGYGTVLNNEVITPVGITDNIYMLASIPIMSFTKDNIQYYVGNNGVCYSSILDAFPIYKSKFDNNINLINLYGVWIYVDNKLNRLFNIPKEFKDKMAWIKMR